MSDTASSIQADGTARGDRPAPLTADRIDTILTDFRVWLEALGDPGEPQPPAERVDLFTLIGQFTALRHEVNMQTKASRTATEQAAEAIKQLAPPNTDEATRPLVKALIDIADALMLSMKQVEKAQAVAEDAIHLQHSLRSVPKPGFFAKLFGHRPAPPADAPAHPDGLEKLWPLVASLADGYELSLRRVERLLPQYGVEPFECVGEAFDPELMEVLEAVDSVVESGTVVEEVRRGYLWNGKLFRFALVKVAR